MYVCMYVCMCVYVHVLYNNDSEFSSTVFASSTYTYHTYTEWWMFCWVLIYMHTCIHTYIHICVCTYVCLLCIQCLVMETVICLCSVRCVLLQEHRQGLKELEQLERQYRSARQQQVAEMPVSKPSAHHTCCMGVSETHKSLATSLSDYPTVFIRICVHVRTYVLSIHWWRQP